MLELFGLSAGWHHRVNVLFHLLNTELLFLVIWHMTGGMAERLCGGTFRGASPACGVRSLGGRAQGRDEHPVLDIDDGCLPEICPVSEREKIHPCSGTLCLGADVQTDAGNVAVCAVAAGLLATGPDWFRADLAKRGSPAGAGENPFTGIFFWLFVETSG